MPINPTTSAWIKGLTTAAITSFATAANAVLALPDVFNVTSQHGWSNLAKIVLVPTGIAVFTYLKTSPLPGTTIPLQAGDTAQLKNVSVTSEGIKADSANIQKADIYES